MKKTLGRVMGSFAFLVGVVLAAVVGIFSALGIEVLTITWVPIALAIIGLIVGLFNITHRETNSFMFSGLVLILSSVFGVSLIGSVPGFGEALMALVVIFVPATIIVAIKNVFVMAKD